MRPPGTRRTVQCMTTSTRRRPAQRPKPLPPDPAGDPEPEPAATAQPEPVTEPAATPEPAASVQPAAPEPAAAPVPVPVITRTCTFCYSRRPISELGPGQAECADTTACLERARQSGIYPQPESGLIPVNDLATSSAWRIRNWHLHDPALDGIRRTQAAEREADQGRTVPEGALDLR
jgi:hypothetical protein